MCADGVCAVEGRSRCVIWACVAHDRSAVFFVVWFNNRGHFQFVSRSVSRFLITVGGRPRTLNDNSSKQIAGDNNPDAR